MLKCTHLLIVCCYFVNHFKTGQEGIKVAHGVNFYYSVFLLSRFFDILTYAKNIMPERSSDGKYITHNKNTIQAGWKNEKKNMLSYPTPNYKAGTFKLHGCGGKGILFFLNFIPFKFIIRYNECYRKVLRLLSFFMWSV